MTAPSTGSSHGPAYFGVDHLNPISPRSAVEAARLTEVEQHGPGVDDQDLVDQPSIVRLIRNALDFRRADGIVIMAGPERIAVRLGEEAYIRTKDGDMEETDGPVTEASLSELEEQGLSLRERFARGAEAAAAS